MSAPYEHVVSVSGGKDSTALYLLALERMEAKGRPFRAVFADTGNEHEWTYQFVRDLPALTGGPEIRWVKADLAHRVVNKRNVVQTKWVKDSVPDDIIARALEILEPTGNPFLDLCLWKGRFPSTKRRFCTEELKVQPIIDDVYAPSWSSGRKVVSWQGVRGEESLARSLLPKWQRLRLDGGQVFAYRPLIGWKLADVWAQHAKHGIEPNRLYAHGMNRVGCMPCIMSKKSELREIARRFPDQIERIAAWEALVSEGSKRGCATFFAAVDDPTVSATDDISHVTHGVHRMVDWSQTDRGGRQTSLLTRLDLSTPCSQWGTCEA